MPQLPKKPVMTNLEMNTCMNAGMFRARSTGDTKHIMEAWRMIVSFVDVDTAYQVWRNLLSNGYLIYQGTPNKDVAFSEGGCQLAVRELVQMPIQAEFAQAFIDGHVLIVSAHGQKYTAYINFKIVDDAVILEVFDMQHSINLSEICMDIRVLSRDMDCNLAPLAGAFTLPENENGKGKCT